MRVKAGGIIFGISLEIPECSLAIPMWAHNNKVAGRRPSRKQISRASILGFQVPKLQEIHFCYVYDNSAFSLNHLNTWLLSILCSVCVHMCACMCVCMYEYVCVCVQTHAYL